MKLRLVILLLGFSILLIGCAQVDGPVESSDPGVELPSSSMERTAVTSASTPQMTDVAGTEPGDKTEPTVARIPDPTPIPCSGMLTSPNQEGPFYSPGSPERSSLIEEGMPGIPVIILGRVFNQDCNPIPGAKLDFWLADVDGEYDNIGYRLRGHVYTDREGNYTLESIEPTTYTGRPPHIHVKVFSSDGEEMLTTQMYFAGSEGSADVSAAPDLLVTYLEPDEDGKMQVIFNFVVQD